MQPLNYAAHAVPSLLAFTKAMAPHAPKTATLTSFLAAALDRSTKFILPKNGELYETHDLTQAELDLCRMPYPFTAAEYEAERETAITDYQSLAIPKRIALGIELNAEFIATAPEWIPQDIWALLGAGFMVWPIDYVGKLIRPDLPWVPSWCGFYFRYDATLGEPGLQDAAYAKIMAGEFKKLDAHSVPFQPMILGEYGKEKLRGLQKRGLNWSVALSVDTGSEWNALRQLAVTLNCQNIATETVAPKRKMSEAHRVQKRKLYEYKILVVPGEKGPSEAHGGTHASPRFHTRRGHIRRLSSGGMTWVRACAVGSPKAGIVDKDYAVREV